MIYVIIFSIFSAVSILIFGFKSAYTILNLILLVLTTAKLVYSFGTRGVLNGLLRISKYILSILVLLLPLYLIYNVSYEKDYSRNSIYSIDKQLENNIKKIKSPIKISLIKSIKTENTVERFYRRIQPLVGPNLKIEKVSVEEEPVLISQKWKMKPGESIYLENENGRSDKVLELNQAELARAVARVNQDQITQACLYEADSMNMGDNSDAGFSQFKIILGDQGINVFKTPLSAINENSCNLVVIPPVVLTSEALTKFTELKQKIPNWWFISDPSLGSLKDLGPSFGFEVQPAIIIDKAPEAEAQSLGWQVMLSKIGKNIITSSINPQNPAVMLMANPVKFINGESLLYSSGNSWGETNLTALQQQPPVASLGDDDLRGSQSALAINSDPNSKMVIVGDLEWLRNSNIILAGNPGLVSNIARWLVNDIQSYSDDTPGIQVISASSFNLQRLFFLIFCEIFVVMGIFICRR